MYYYYDILFILCILVYIITYYVVLYDIVVLLHIVYSIVRVPHRADRAWGGMSRPSRELIYIYIYIHVCINHE